MTIATAETPPAITCSVHGLSQGRSTTFQGQIAGTSALSGTYRLTVIKSGRGGRSRIAQAGTFSLEAGGSVLVGSMTLNLELGSEIDARLDVTADGQRFTCQSMTGDQL